MRLRGDQKGFSLVEMIIVVAIIGIMSGIAIRVTGYITLANSEKAAKTLEASLGKLQAKALSKSEKTYLYLYELDGVYYVCTSAVDLDALPGKKAEVLSKSNGTAVGSGMKIFCRDDGGTKQPVGGEGYLKISYKRDGTFDGFPDSVNVRSILIEGSFSKEIKLIKDTGRYIVRDVVEEVTPTEAPE